MGGHKGRVGKVKLWIAPDDLKAAKIIGDRPRFIWVLILARVQANSSGIHSQNSIPSS